MLSYINIRDRGSPPVFVGREEIFQRLAKDVEECRSNTRGSTSFTRVIHGAPGVGKTSLLVELKERLGSGIGGSKRIHDTVVVVSISGGMFFREAFVANRIIEACIGKVFDFQIEQISSTSAQAEATGFGASHGRTTKKRALEQEIQNAGELWKSVLDNTSINKDETVFLLLIDEAQSIRGVASESGENHIVMNLHEGADAVRGLKIVPVFVGLSNTVSVLADRGISRLPEEAFTRLGSLTRDETEELVSMWMQRDEFGFENLFSQTDINRVSKMIAVASEGWPRHATTYLRELGSSILDQGERNDPTVDITEVFERGHNRRLAHYDARLTAADLDSYEEVICDAAIASPDGLIELSKLFEIAERDYDLSRSEYTTLHKKAIRSGILEQDHTVGRRHFRFRFPIPSFLTYMRCDGDEREFKAKMREQMDEHSHLWS